MQIIKKLSGYLLAVAFLAVPVVVYAQRQEITDWWRLRDYTAPISVVRLADETAMTPSARHIFYVNHPKIDSLAATFRQDCSTSEQTIVLGCYHGNQGGIFVYDVTDERLAGVEQVTAAHEMLHAAYDRLEEEERQRVDALLENYYKTQLNDERIKKTIDSYRKTEPTELINEMHSIFGTEILTLPVELEKYYKQYFTDRSKVVGFAQNYQGEFTKRQNQINAYDAQAKDLKAKIDNTESSLSQQLADLQTSKAKLDSLRDSGQIAAYNAAVPGFNSKVNAYNSSINKLQSDISTYNNLIATRNNLAKEIRELDQALDTRLQKQSAQ